MARAFGRRETWASVRDRVSDSPRAEFGLINDPSRRDVPLTSDSQRAGLPLAPHSKGEQRCNTH